MRYLILVLTTGVSACSGIQPDKVQHAIMGAGVSVVATELGATPLQACFASLAVGIAKEAYDSKYGGTVETMDALATLGGCAITWEF